MSRSTALMISISVDFISSEFDKEFSGKALSSIIVLRCFDSFLSLCLKTIDFLKRDYSGEIFRRMILLTFEKRLLNFISFNLFHFALLDKLSTTY